MLGPRYHGLAIVLGALTIVGSVSQNVSAQTARPNVVIMYADNLGFGEVGIYGGVRGVPQPADSQRGATVRGRRFLYSSPKARTRAYSLSEN